MLKDFFIDPSSGQYSCSRLVFFLTYVIGLPVACYLACCGQGLHATAIITGLAATAAGVYAVSTNKKNSGEDL